MNDDKTKKEKKKIGQLGKQNGQIKIECADVEGREQSLTIGGAWATVA